MKKYVLFLMALTTVALVGCGNAKKNEETNLNNNVETQIDQVENIPSDININEPEGNEKSEMTDEEAIHEAFENYIQGIGVNSGDELAEYKIESIRIVSGDEKEELITNFPESYQDSDILANVIFSVRPENPNSMVWQAGNGEPSGDWVFNKSLVVTLREGSLMNVGTGW